MINDQDFIDAFQEFLNIGVGRATAVLSEMLQLPISLTVPGIEVFKKKELDDSNEEYLKEVLSTVQLDFTGKFSGKAGLVFPTQSAVNLVSALTGDDEIDENLSTYHSVTVNEVGNIILNGLMGSIANMLKEHLDYSVPIYSEESIKNIINTGNIEHNSMVILGRARFSVKELEIQGDVLLVLELSQFEEFNRLITSAQ